MEVETGALFNNNQKEDVFKTVFKEMDHLQPLMTIVADKTTVTSIINGTTKQK